MGLELTAILQHIYVQKAEHLFQATAQMVVCPCKKKDTTWIILVSLIKDDVKCHWAQTLSL